MEVFSIIANCRKSFSKKFKTAKYYKKLPKPANLTLKGFPENSITRKMHMLSNVAPKQIREQKIVYKILKLVERVENLHCKLNKLE